MLSSEISILLVIVASVAIFMLVLSESLSRTRKTSEAQFNRMCVRLMESDISKDDVISLLIQCLRNDKIYKDQEFYNTSLLAGYIAQIMKSRNNGVTLLKDYLLKKNFVTEKELDDIAKKIWSDYLC